MSSTGHWPTSCSSVIECRPKTEARPIVDSHCFEIATSPPASWACRSSPCASEAAWGPRRYSRCSDLRALGSWAFCVIGTPLPIGCRPLHKSRQAAMLKSRASESIGICKRRAARVDLCITCFHNRLYVLYEKPRKHFRLLGGLRRAAATAMSDAIDAVHAGASLRFEPCPTRRKNRIHKQ